MMCWLVLKVLTDMHTREVLNHSSAYQPTSFVRPRVAVYAAP